MRTIDLPASDVQPSRSMFRDLGRVGKITLCVVLALAFAILLSGREIPAALDDETYLTYAAHSSEILEAKMHDWSGIGSFLDEPGWLLLNLTLAQFFDGEVVVRIIIFCTSLAAFLSVARLVNWSALQCAAFFIFPMALVPYVTHLRQGTAIAAFFVFLAFFPRRIVAGTLLAAAIHSSFVPILALVVMERYEYLRSFLRRVPSLVLLVTWLALVWLAALALKYLLDWAGDRRVDEYSFAIDQTATGLGFLLWLAIAVVLFLGRKKEVLASNWHLALAMVTLYLGWYFFLDVGARALVSGLIFIWLEVQICQPTIETCFFRFGGLQLVTSGSIRLTKRTFSDFDILALYILAIHTSRRPIASRWSSSSYVLHPFAQ